MCQKFQQAADEVLKKAVNLQLKTLCFNVKKLCGEKEITISELSKKTGVPVYLLQKLERGEVSKRFVAAHLLLICEYFKIMPSDLLS